jgi:SCY1-like protein 1
MLKAFEFGGGGTKVFSIILTITEKLSDDDFEKDVQPVVVRMFASQERGVRMCLLENLSRVIERLNAKVVNDKIFPNMVNLVKNLLMKDHRFYRCGTCDSRTDCSGSTCC